MKRLKKYRFCVSTILFLSIAAAFWVQTYSIKSSKFELTGVISATTLPRIIIAGLTALTVVDFVFEWRKQRLGKTTDLPSIRNGILSLLCMLVCAGMMKPLGFVISGTLLASSLLIILADQPRTKKFVACRIAIALGITLVVFLIFRYFFKYAVPTGYLWS